MKIDIVPEILDEDEEHPGFSEIQSNLAENPLT